MLRTKQSIESDMYLTKGYEKQFYVSAKSILDLYDEEYLISERQKITDKIERYKSRLPKEGEKDFNGTESEIKAEIKILTRKLKMFNYLLL